MESSAQEINQVDTSGAGSDWPPIHFADNDWILTWWLPDYDDALRRLAERRSWAWQEELGGLLRSIVPENVLEAWVTSDPLCQKFAWYNVLQNFAIARAKQQGFAPRKPRTKTCAACSTEFRETEVPLEFVERVGVENVDFCYDCLKLAFSPHGSDDATAAEIAAVVRNLADALGRAPTEEDLKGKADLVALSADARRAAVRVLAVKPSCERVQEVFGSASGALAHTHAGTHLELPPIDHQRPSSRPPLADVGGPDWPAYQHLMGPLPNLTSPLASPTWRYHEEISSLIATGALALAESALRELCLADETFYLDLARLYAQTARREEAATALDRFNRMVRRDTSTWYSVDALPAPRDIRTVTSTPIFYAPLQSRPRGNVRFVLIGGAMEYVDRRGEHICVSGETTGDDGGLAENVSRMSAMLESSDWARIAVHVVQAILEGVRRNQSGDHNAHALVYASGLREAVKVTTGAPPKSLDETDWCLGPTGKTHWSRERSPGRYVFNAHRGFSLIEIRQAPAAVIWAWPDRSDLCLQAFLDTAAAGADPPMIVVLPDIPDFRRFARAYVRASAMDHVERSFLEDALYHEGDVPNQRGVVLSSEFAPRLVIQPDGRELDGALLTSALAYLDARHNVRLSVWEVLSDPLLSESAARTSVIATRSAVTSFKRNEMVMWYAQYREFPGWRDEIFRPFRPHLLDAE